MIEPTFRNITERSFLGDLLQLFKPAIRISTRDWARKYRVLTSEESFKAGKFDPDFIPALEYVYDCMDNRHIWIIVAMKGSQIGWSELTNNVIGRTIHTSPQKMQWSFPGKTPAITYSREKLKPFFKNTVVLREIVNKGLTKPSSEVFMFSGGWLKLVTLGSIASAKTSSIQFIGVEEPDDVTDNVKGQGDTLENVTGRQKTFKVGQKKLIYGGTPTDKDFSRVDAGYSQSNKLVFKACCHHCGDLSELSTDNIKWDDYQDRYIDEVYGKYNPKSAYYECPSCLGVWTDSEKMANVEKGKESGFTDFTGGFSKGWHPKRPKETTIFGFHIPELLSTLSTATFKDIAEKKIKAIIALEKGEEGLMKSFVNNTDRLAYSSGITSLDASEMKKLRKNYPEGIVPMEGLTLTAGVDVQDNRFAITIRAWGRNNNSWLVTWVEIFGDVLNEDAPIWDELAQKLLHDTYPHAGGKSLKIEAVSIDSADNTELVYKWVLKNLHHNDRIFAVKGLRDLQNTESLIYKEPAIIEATRESQARQTLAETMGVTVYQLGAHNAHAEILRRVQLNSNPDAKSNIYFFNEQSYGEYEEQMTSCRKLVDTRSRNNRARFKLVPGKRKEAIDSEKLALHANYAAGVRNWMPRHWQALEDHLYK